MGEVVFPAEGFALLRDLRENNNREWFGERKVEIERNVLGPAQDLVGRLSNSLSESFSGAFAGKVLRIYRDVRFSKDKTPYTPYVRLALSRPGGEPGEGVCLYLSFEPETYVVGTGVWDFGAERLGRFRQALLDGERRAILDEVLAELERNGARLSPPELTRPPKEFRDAADPTHFRRKGLTAWIDTTHEMRPIDHDEITSRIATLAPLYKWLEQV